MTQTRRIAFRIALFAVLLTAVILSAGNQDRAREQWMRGYMKLNEAETAETSGDLAVAVKLLRDAEAVFLEVRRKYPSWNPSLLSYRITYCRERLTRLQASLKARSESMSPEQLVDAVRDGTDRMQQLETDKRELQRKLTATQEALERARREAARNAGGGADVAGLLEEKRDLITRLQTAEADVARLTKELAALRDRTGVDAATRKLKAELSRVAAARDEYQNALDTYRRAYENVKARLTNATRTRDRLINEYKQVRAARDAAAAAREELQARLDRIQQALVASEADRKTAEEDAARKAEALAASEAERDGQAQALVALRAEVAALKRTGGQTRDELATAADAAETLRRELAAATAAAAESDAELIKARNDVARLRDDAARADAALTAMTAERDAWRAKAEARGGQDEGAAPEDLEALRLAHRQEVARLEADAHRQTTASRRETARLQAAATALQTELDAAKADLADTRAAAAAHRDDMEALETRLKGLEHLPAKVAAAEAAVKREKATAADLATQLQTQIRQCREAREALDAGQLRTAQLARRLAAIEQERDALDERVRRRTDVGARWEEIEAELRDRIDELEMSAQRVEKERRTLAAKDAQHVALLRQQEDKIAALETAQAEAADALAARDAEIERLHEDARLVAAKSEAINGLTASLSEADAQQENLSTALRQAESERDAARVRLKEADAEILRRRREVERYRDELERTHDPDDGRRVLVQQLRELSAQLEKETQRRRALEKALSEQGSDGAGPAPAATDVMDEEQQRRRREVRYIVRGLLRQGIDAEAAGNTEAAGWNYRRILDFEADHKVAVQRLGLLAAEQGDDAEAVRYLRRAFVLDPGDQDTLLPLGFALARRGQPELAVSMLTRAVALQPESFDAHRCLGVACSSLGWHDAAEVQLRRAHDLKPDNAEVAFNLAILLATRDQPRLEEARNWYRKARDRGMSPDPKLDDLFGYEN